MVHETFEQGIYTDAVALSQSEYGTTSQYYSNSSSSTSGTAVVNVFTYSGTGWETRSMPSNRYYHFNFTIPTDGNYQLCYELSSGHTANYLYIYQGTNTVYINGSYYINASTTGSKSGCIDLGKVSANTSYRVVQRAYSPISTLKFSIKKANKTETIDTGYRYEGKNPNNWVWFNNELWRIIGVFDSKTHGVSNTNLVKIIRANPIGGSIIYDNKDTMGNNNWGTSSLYKLLNPIEGDENSGYYYYSKDGTQSDYCYGYYYNGNSTQYIIKTRCNYSNIGINSVNRKMIKKAIWKLGTLPESVDVVKSTYNTEREGSEKEGYIGLMYPSDYGYSALVNDCNRETRLSSFDSPTCAGKSWLYGSGEEWFISPSAAGSHNVTQINPQGSVIFNAAAYGTGVRPTLYLNENVYVLDGTGSESDPYIIEMD